MGGEWGDPPPPSRMPQHTILYSTNKIKHSVKHIYKLMRKLPHVSQLLKVDMTGLFFSVPFRMCDLLGGGHSSF